MIDASQAVSNQRTPDLSPSGQPSRQWTRVVYQEAEICNSLAELDWDEGNPVQVLVCTECGCPGRAPGGYVHVSKVGGDLLWTRPRIDKNDDYEVSQYLPLPGVGHLGAVRIPLPVWDAWRRRAECLPEGAAFEHTRRVDLADAWLLELPASFRADDVAGLLRHLDRWLLACDALPVEEALHKVAQLAEWVNENPGQPVTGSLVTAGSAERPKALKDGRAATSLCQIGRSAREGRARKVAAEVIRASENEVDRAELVATPEAEVLERKWTTRP